MHSIAQTYSDLGRYQHSLDLSKKTLKFRIENCPDDHLEIGRARFADNCRLNVHCNIVRQLHDTSGLRAHPSWAAA